MKVILYMALTANGYIAKEDGDSDWVAESDWKQFSSVIKGCGAVVMGRNTYELCDKDGIFPFENALNIVATRKKSLLRKKDNKDSVFTERTPKEIVDYAEKKGFNKLLLIGGTKLNTSFMKDGLIEEIYLSVHPLVFEKGMKIFKGIKYEHELELVKTNTTKEGVVQLHYKIKK